MKYYKGRFKPTNPSKYKGDPTNIIYRSMWEFRVMRYFDSNQNVIQWSSEEIAIPYRSPIDGKWHRYFPDFVITIKDKDNNIKVFIIEVKPENQTKPPKVRTKATKKYVTEVATWGINSSKWQAADEYCKDRKWSFQILTERHLGIK